MTQEEMSGPQENDGETHGREADEARPESHRALKATQVQGSLSHLYSFSKLGLKCFRG